MLTWYHLVLSSVSAAVVALLGHWLMARTDRRRRARRVFAESIHRCCEELEDAAIRYWAEGDGEHKTAIQAARMKAALMKMARFIHAEPSVIVAEERRELRQSWAETQKTTKDDFESGPRRANPEQIALMVGRITNIRVKIAGMLRE